MSTSLPPSRRTQAGAVAVLVARFGPFAASLACAVVLWLVVHNLDRSPARFNVPITYEVGPGVIVLSDRVAEVELQVRATKAKLRTLQATSFVVRVKHASERLGRESVVLDASDVEAPFGVVVERVTPSQFSITYDRRVQQDVPVQVDIQGRPAAGHEVVLADVKVDPATITLSGPQSLFSGRAVVRTERVDVTNRRESLKVSHLTLIIPGPSFSTETGVDVDAVIPIRPISMRRTFDDVPIDVMEGSWKLSKPNPPRLRVTIEGDEQELAGLAASAVTARIDARTLSPRDEDYHLEPEIRVDQRRCASCKVVTRSQTRVDITVKASRRLGGRRSAVDAPRGAGRAS